jgi:RHH-type transcriptional regulator, rel operon repressor / antitoxin RelB
LYTLAAIENKGAAMSSVLSVRVPDSLKAELELLSVATRRSKAFLAQEALGEYVRRNAWRARALQDALTEADKGAFIAHEAVAAWAESLGTDDEKSVPVADIHLPAR